MTAATVPEIEVVAIRTSGPHDHIERVKFSDGTDADAETVKAAILAHDAHYVMHRPDLDKPLLLHVRQCPDCLEECLWA
jgi:hypothetical protein